MSGELVIHRNVYEMEDLGTLKLKADYAVTGKIIGRRAARSNLSWQQQNWQGCGCQGCYAQAASVVAGVGL